MNFRKWKLSLIVAGITGVLTAITTGAIVPTVTLKQLAYLIAVSFGKDVLLFLKQHPVEDIQTTFITKDQVK